MNQPIGSPLVRTGVTFALVILAFVAVAAFAVPTIVATYPQGAVAAPVAVALALAVAAAFALRATREHAGEVEGVFEMTAPLLPIVLADAICGLFHLV